jgi:hypothetical protein
MPKTKSAAPPPANSTLPVRPIHTIRHRSLKVSIWRNDTAKGPVYNVTLVRGYRDGEEWKDSHSFGYDDLPIIAKLLDDAHSFITGLRAKEPARQPSGAKSQSRVPQPGHPPEGR